MIEAADKAAKKLFVVKQNRYKPPVVFLKELLVSLQNEAHEFANGAEGLKSVEIIEAIYRQN